MEHSSTAPGQKLKTRAVKGLYRVRRRIATAFAIVLALFFGYYVMAGRNGVSVYEQKRVADRELKRQIDALQQENDRLKEHVDRLKNDPDAIEHEARERLHYARPGEVIYTLNDSPGNDSHGANQPQAPAAANPGSK
jgi:cell division protein FtsB